MRLGASEERLMVASRKRTEERGQKRIKMEESVLEELKQEEMEALNQKWAMYEKLFKLRIRNEELVNQCSLMHSELDFYQKLLVQKSNLPTKKSS